jgi:deoxyribodipyrimidine photo-lyase
LSGRAVVLFTRDLRTHDHPALATAARAHEELVPLFVLDDRLLRSANRTAFLLDALADLRGSLGGALVVRRGRAETIVASLRPSTVYLTSDTGPFGRARERVLREIAPVHALPGTSIVEPRAVAPAGGDHYRVFTPYWHAWLTAQRRAPERPVGAVRLPRGIEPGPLPTLADLGLGEPSPVLPRGGEREGRRLLGRFLADAAASYGETRDLLAAGGTSRLSPYLRLGCISPLELADATNGAAEYLRQLCWRDFCLQLRAAFPRLTSEDYRQRGHEWRHDPGALAAWREGRTGVPIVDAGMRQLRHEGWMHNRARLLTASFLVKQLGIDWRLGLAHFDALLVDGDPASNAANWQWVAGTGTDPRPNRVFNPIRQARRLDPNGEYVRRFLPELRGLDAREIHEPWRLAAASLRDLGYPLPLVELRATA